jgi:hypothetical protein
MAEHICTWDLKTKRSKPWMPAVKALFAPLVLSALADDS